MALTQVDQGLLGTYAQYTGFKNRIINGAMVIDQRNAGAVKTLTASTVTYTVDRFGVYCTTGTGHTYQQVSDAPAGFVNSWKFTVGTGGTPSSGQQNVGPYQIIEGYNITDFNWGTASAQPATLSFWVKSSLTGTFSVAIQSSNASATVTYVATYTVASANTWQYTTITIPANTINVPYTNNNGGISVFFGLGSGSTFTTTANTWTVGDFKFATGSVNILGTNGATFQITGVQLEKGSTATSFDYRPYGTELQLCQRYYQKSYNYATVPGTSITSSYPEAVIFAGWGTTNAAKMFTAEHKVPLRPGTQSLSFWDIAGNASKISTFDTGFTRTDNVGPVGGSSVTENRHYNAPGTSTYNGWAYAYVVSSEL